jgi:hypothetical protein
MAEVLQGCNFDINQTATARCKLKQFVGMKTVSQKQVTERGKVERNGAGDLSDGLLSKHALRCVKEG